MAYGADGWRGRAETGSVLRVLLAAIGSGTGQRAGTPPRTVARAGSPAGHGGYLDGPHRTRRGIGRQRLGGVDVVSREATNPRSIPLSTRRANTDPIADPTATDRTKMARTTRNIIMARHPQTLIGS